MSDSLFVRYLSHVQEAVRRIVPDLPDEVAARVELTPTRDAAHGDMATNAALLVAKIARRRPAEIAAELAAALVAVPGIAKAEPAGPGFVNLTLDAEILRSVVSDVLRAGESYGDGAIGQGVRVNVEYVSANPTGPMHVGHCRGAVVGDALANLLLKAGYDVTKEYYINDAGAQVSALAWAAYWRYLQAIGTPMDEEAFAALVPGGIQYGGDYLVPVGQALAELHGTGLAATGAVAAPVDAWFATVKSFTVAEMMRMIREDLEALGVRHDVFTSEAQILADGMTDRAIGRLDALGLLYEGVLEPPKGKLPDDWEARPQTLFRSTAFGDDVDRPLRKSDGSNTYFANDIGYHDDKIRRGADVLIDVWGADHGGYVTRMKAAVKALAGKAGKPDLDVLLCQIVRIVRDGQPVRMSKRAGTFVTLRDLIDEVGRDAVRFTMLTRKADAQMEFDLDQVVAQTRDNPVFYVQYAHARCRSVLRAAQEMLGADAITPVALAEAPLDGLESDVELALLRRMAQWPRTIEGAAQAKEPHRVAFYLGELAADFHTLWNRGRDDATLRFLQEDDPQATRTKLAMVEATATVIRSGLAVLGVEPVEEMR
ncbi:arginine--tRNA ligase [Gluconacetobacter azotocaptans]|uniref:Arginine--tRNA ligase n=1 Tax=Gluconacetobacter azotocaptans TaxID=142834 RepID=A0A7W4JRP1_9PROT|nr:arginine--tRNA ligase [Gluconacetobacter azotocaptans]MBB2189633.1 arginine--tRNA ligase [Gluconacetobacter azotocaptans]GBQ36345.1 arginyl-tRNA synthetase [Gluconacetobacter azotocaptans DSM 13594]